MIRTSLVTSSQDLLKLIPKNLWALQCRHSVSIQRADIFCVSRASRLLIFPTRVAISRSSSPSKRLSSTWPFVSFIVTWDRGISLIALCFFRRRLGRTGTGISILWLSFDLRWYGRSFNLCSIRPNLVLWTADFVNNNPTAFAQAYFDFAAIRVYQKGPYSSALEAHRRQVAHKH